MHFRAAKLDDVPRLLELEQCVVEAERPFNDSIKAESATYYDLQDLISSERSFLLVVEVGDEIIASGYAQLRQSKKALVHQQHAYLGFMYVVPEYRGNGLNSLVIEQLIEWSKAQGVQDYYLDVYAENDSAIKAYEKVGFKSSLVEMKLSQD